MGRHIVKTTIEIADDLFERAQRLARKEKTTFRALDGAGTAAGIEGKASKTEKAAPTGDSPGSRSHRDV